MLSGFKISWLVETEGISITAEVVAVVVVVVAVASHQTGNPTCSDPSLEHCWPQQVLVRHDNLKQTR